MKNKLLFYIIFIPLFLTCKNVFALSNTWDLNLDTQYTLSNSVTTNVSWWAWSLTMQLNHEWSINNGVWWALMNNVEDIIIEWNYAYLASAVSDAIEILDISNPASPSHVSSIVNGAWWATLDDPRSLVKNGNYLYVSVNGSDRLEVIDVTNPASPTHVVSIQDTGTTYLNQARWLALSWNYLYVTSYADDAVTIFDVSSPALPIRVWSLRDTSRLDGAIAVSVSWNYAYVVSDRNDSLQIIDITSKSAPVFIWEIINWAWWALINSPYGVVVSWNYAYIASRISDVIEIVDISNPASPTHATSIANGWTTLLNEPRDIYLEWNTIYVASHTSDAIEVIDISDPLNPVHIISMWESWATELNGATSIQKVWDYIYVWSRIDDWFEIAKITYDASSPNIVPNDNLLFSGSIDKITTTLWWENQWNITYQISKNNGVTWYYLVWTTWTITTGWTVDSNTPTEINAEIQSFNWLAWWTGEFKWKAFLNWDWSQKVQLDEVKVDYTSWGWWWAIIDFETPGWYTVIQWTWTRVTTDQQEWTYSIESWNRTDNSTSCFEVQKDIFVDSQIKFYKQISSEANYDFLKFYIDGLETSAWSWNVTWSQESYNISNGSHTFRWCYEKDGSVTTAQDRWWVDYIEIVETTPVVWAALLDFEIAWGYTITTNVTPEDWTRVTTEKYEWSYSIESQNRTDNTNACFERTQTVWPIETGITFYKKVSSEVNYDFLKFFINGTQQDSWAWEIDWSKHTYSLTPWNYTLRWCYEKDGSVSNGQDRAWIDIVTITSDPPVLTQVSPIPTPTNDNTPTYSFNSPLAWPITYGGSCTSSTTDAVIWNNTIIFNSLVDGIYTDCTIQVTGTPENSTILAITNFTVDTTRINITINNPIDGNTIANTSFELDVSYFDTESGVDTSSIIIDLRKFDGSVYWSDISATFIDTPGWAITQTGAIYDVSQLWSGQYKLDFTISDNTWNDGTSSAIIYIEQSPLTLTTTANNSGWWVFSYEFTVENTSVNNITDWIIWFQLDNGTIDTSSGWVFSNTSNLYEIRSNISSTDVFTPWETHTISFSWIWNGIVTDLYLKWYTNISPEAPLDYSLSQNWLDVDVTTSSQTWTWYCRNVALTNNGTEDITNWQVTFELDQMLTTTWSGTFSKSWLNHTIAPLSNANIIIWNTENIVFCTEWLKADKNWLITIVTLSLWDIIAPTISSTDPIENEVKNTGTFNFVFNYTDNVGWDGIDVSSDEIYLYKWNGSSYGPDIASINMFLWSKTITTTSAIYPSNSITDGQYKGIFKIFDLNNNFITTSIVFSVWITPLDSTPPSIVNIFPTDNILYPNADFDISINYSDTGSSINTSSIIINLERWNGTARWSDIFLWFTTGNTITATNATYNISALWFWKYKLYFYIEDSIGNWDFREVIFYTDEPELIISTGSLDIWALTPGSNSFSISDFTITVKTVWAWFNVILNNNTNLTTWTIDIINWNGISGYWFEANPYTSTINLINSNQIIATQAGNINSDWNKNTYVYNINFWANIDWEQAAWNYSSDIKFWLNLNY